MSRKQLWLDIRDAGEATEAVREEALHQGFDAIVAADPAGLAPLPPSIARILDRGGDLIRLDGVDEPAPEKSIGTHVEVVDAATLDRACELVREDGTTVLTFRDPTNIPMEIVLAAAAARSTGTIITTGGLVDDLIVHLSVLEHGPDGVMLTAPRPGDATRLAALARAGSPRLDLVPLTVTGIRHAGTGERACVDTCSYLAQDEGILVGSRSKAMMLCVSETHPLPYMPTRPFRVNAGAIMSYTLADAEHTRYLTELTAGDTVLAVGADGRTRRVTVGRVKIETRPLLSIDATAPTGEQVNLIVQDDWHVRVLGPGAAVLNTTELRPGVQILGHLPGRERHVGYPIDELCYEQ